MAATQTGSGATPNGTPWRTYRETVPSAGTVEWGLPESRLGATGTPLMLYTHGAAGSSSDFRNLAAWSQLRNWVIDNGIAWVEGTGGGPSAWGNDASKLAYETAYQHVADQLQPDVSFGLFRSMGGIVGEWLLTQSEVTAEHLKGAIVNSGTADLMYRYQDRDNGALDAAWGTRNFSEFQAVASSSDPMQFSPSAWDSKWMLQMVGTADTTVPMGPHGLALRSRYSGHVALDMLDIRQGGDHSTANGSYLQVGAMVSYIQLVLGMEPPAPSDDKKFRIAVSGARLVGNEWRPRLNVR